MFVTSLYSVFTTNKMSDLLDSWEESGALTIAHRFENDSFEYYVMKDASGNATDFIQFKNETTKEGFFAMRMNVNNFDRMKLILTDNGYIQKGDICENGSCKYGLFISTTDEPNVMLFYHKKGTTTDAYELVMKHMLF